MKLTAAVIREALAEWGRWREEGTIPEAVYAFPRHYDGNSGICGHVLVVYGEIPASDPPVPGCDCTGSLLVFTAPAGAKSAAADARDQRMAGTYAAGPCLVPEEPVPAGQILQCLTDLYDRMDAWEEALEMCGQDMAGIQRMLEITASFTGAGLGLIDVSYNMPAYTGSMARGLGLQAQSGVQRPDDANIASLAEDPQITAIRSVRGVHTYENPLSGGKEGEALYCNMFRPGENTYYNRLLFAREPGIYTAADFYMVEVLARKIGKITTHLSTFSLPSSELAALKKLVVRAAEPEYRYDAAAAAALRMTGWDRHDRYRFYIFSYMYPERDNGITEYMLRSIERLIPSSCGEVKDGRILLIQNITRGKSDVRELRQTLAEFLRENMYKAGISGPVYSAAHLRGAYLQAEAAMRLGTDRDPMFWYYLFEDYRMDYLIRKSSGEIQADLLVMPVLQDLLREDKEKGTHFVETLCACAEENFNVTRTAQRLFVHRTSLQDRLNRIRERTGLDLDDPETRFDLLFSLKLLSHSTGPELTV